TWHLPLDGYYCMSPPIESIPGWLAALRDAYLSGWPAYELLKREIGDTRGDYHFAGKSHLSATGACFYLAQKVISESFGRVGEVGVGPDRVFLSLQVPVETVKSQWDMIWDGLRSLVVWWNGTPCPLSAMTCAANREAWDVHQGRGGETIRHKPHNQND